MFPNFAEDPGYLQHTPNQFIAPRARGLRTPGPMDMWIAAVKWLNSHGGTRCERDRSCSRLPATP
jgi:hypothetical protein